MHEPDFRPLSRVVIVGCGFGGLAAAKALRGAALQVTLVDRTNHHLFQPLRGRPERARRALFKQAR